ADHAHDIKGDNDVLVLSQPHVIRQIHDAYLEAGADIVETNTFNATAIAQADYKLEHRVRDINYAAARIARECADEWTNRTPDKPRFVAAARAPTTRRASISPDVNDPGARNVRFDELLAAYGEAIEGLADRGAEHFLVGNIFDHTNSKAALSHRRVFFRPRQPSLSDHRLRHHHRRIGPHAFRPDDGGVLEFGAPCAPPRGRPQLLARRRADAALHRGDGARG